MLRRLRTFAFLAVVLGLSVSGNQLFGQSTPVADEFAGLHFRSIGPAQASGRVSDIAVYEANPATFWVGSAHGGVWKTTNNGATFTPQFQHNGLMSVGDLAVSQKNPDLVWLGTGEPNNRQSSGWGDGVYKSTDGGATWKLMGLPTSRHVGRIVIDPEDDNIVFVAAVGSLWGPGGERGVYKTTDGGATWKAVLKVDENTGANDLVMAAGGPQDPVRLDVSAPALAVLHERRRARQRHLQVHRRRRHLDEAHATACRRSTWAGSRSTRIARAPTSCMPKCRPKARRAAVVAAAVARAVAAARRVRVRRVRAARPDARAAARRARARRACLVNRVRPQPRRRRPAPKASIDRTTAARRGGGWATTRTAARCTSASCVSIRTTPIASSSRACACPCPPTEAAPSRRSISRCTTTSTPSGGIRTTRTTCSSAPTAARIRPGT